jgi:hypothetical protein
MYWKYMNKLTVAIEKRGQPYYPADMNWLRRRTQRLSGLAPLVCAFCEGGSGVILDQDRGIARRCEHCGGMGESRQGSHEVAGVLNERLRGSSGKRPRHVA